MSNKPDFNSLLKKLRQGIQERLQKSIPKNHESNLVKSMHHTFAPESKLLRPMLLACTALDLGSDHWRMIEHAATAIECIHVYSLIHDDLPAMDDDPLRRGQASCHIAFDEATAILAGDALLTLAFDLLADPSLEHAELQCQLIHCLTQASGHLGMAQGQVLDLHTMSTDTSLATLESIYELKTGKLIEAAVKMGMLIANLQDPNQLSDLADCAHQLGLAFQIQDDILDITSSPEESGKPQLSDADRSKPTFPSLIGLKGSQDRVNILKQDCIENIKKCNFNNSLIKTLIIRTIK